MPISSNLVTATQTRIDAVTSSCCANDFALAATAATEMSCYDSNRKVSVATVNDLPNIETNNIGPGHIVFVESINAPVMSYESGWMGLDRRVLRRDVYTKRLWMWGYANSGALGTNNTTNTSSPVTTAGGGTNWNQISSGTFTTTAIKSDGTLWVWGNNGAPYYRLGTGDATNYSSPVTVAGGGTTWCQVSAGGYGSSALKTDGTLWVWGWNIFSQLGDGTTTSRCSPVTTIGAGTNWKQVSNGAKIVGAVKTDGTLWTWGQNLYGALGTNDTTNYSSPVTTAGGGTTWCQISNSVKSTHMSAIKTDGTLWMWGRNQCGQLGTGNITDYSSPVTTVAGGTNWCRSNAGTASSAAIKTDGTLWTWGSNSCGILGTGNTTNYSSPVTVAGGGTTWCQVSIGGYKNSAAVKTDGTLWTWGIGGYGSLGTGNTTNYSSPVTVAGGGTTWCQVSAGDYHTGAITSV